MTDDARITQVLSHLLEHLRVSRVTLRRHPDAHFPVTQEALAPGVLSARGVRTELRPENSPVFNRISQTRSRVVEQDCQRAARLTPDFAAPSFVEMMATYGGLRAFVVEPLLIKGEVIALLSVHDLADPRSWTSQEIDDVACAARRILDIIETPR